jgi:hypothetical protein
MGILKNLFSSTRGESLILIDISAGAVAGAYAHYKKDSQPALLFTRRLPIEVREGEPHEDAMLRALQLLGSVLVRDGAPVLVRHTGSGSADTILISVDAPWQETKVRTELFERTTPFVFTKDMVKTALEKTSVVTPGKLLVDESIIGTELNGYETRDPYGKKVRRATVIVLTSLIDEKVSQSIVSTLRSLFHTSNILSIAGSSLRYQAIRTVFPHEKNALILDAIGSLLSISLVRKGFLVAVTEMSENISARHIDVWAQKVVSEFTELAKRFPLPRTLFLLTQEQDVSALEQALNEAKLSGLWLSDNPPKVVSVLASHIASSVQQITTAAPDLPLLLMALYWQKRPEDQ